MRWGWGGQGHRPHEEDAQADPGLSEQLPEASWKGLLLRSRRETVYRGAQSLLEEGHNLGKTPR